jgi:hypothetical protein
LGGGEDIREGTAEEEQQRLIKKVEKPKPFISLVNNYNF